MHCRRVSEHHADEREIDRKRCGTCAFLGATASEGDEFRLGELGEGRVAQILFQAPEDMVLRPAHAFADIDEILDVKVDEVAEGGRFRAQARGGPFPLIDVALGLDRLTFSIAFA
jgi:hypothetical protein